ncbi:hypothetical protein BKA67DRAFT_579892 [Truncatella angustata]|uniref:Apple domain-containing protein n=1 Tax=Truncatella angustata TaxID=152316 RepID=A0A9P8RNM3_9PEZI|nr:uncharacterized protein BKA67DRAFT_579892 [Truncatella angustata]KAH6646525.1 hypothetical protein BKA67DRAFT_579892 [Truncatella angustata]
MAFRTIDSELPELNHRDDRYIEVVPHESPQVMPMSQPLQSHPDGALVNTPRPRRKLFGIPWSTVAFSVTIAFVVIGASVGGAVGSTQALHHQTEYQVVTITSITVVAGTQTSSVPTASGTLVAPFNVPTADVTLALDCENRDGKTEPLVFNDTTYVFSQHCGTDFERVTPSSVSLDLFTVAVYTLQDCLRACVSYNLAHGSKECIAVEFNRGILVTCINNLGLRIYTDLKPVELHFRL